MTRGLHKFGIRHSAFGIRRISFIIHHSSFRISSRSAFTLLELLLVLLLVAILSTLTAVSFASAARTATVRDAITQITFADARARDLVRNTNRPVTLTINPQRSTITRTDPISSAIVATLSGVHIDQFLTADNSDSILYSSQAQSPTYALLLRAPHTKPTWLLITGPTGIPFETQNDSEIHAIFAKIAPSGHPD